MSSYKAISHHYTGPIKDFLSQQTQCLNCKTELVNNDIHYYRGYCSYECFTTRPPMTAYLEHAFKAEVRTVLTTALNMAATIGEAASALGIQRETLTYLIGKHKIRKVVKWK